VAISVPAQYRPDVAQAARATGMSPDVVAAQIDEESGFRPDAVSPTGAEGIAQFEPGTWAAWGHGSPFNPTDAFRAYAAYMGALLRQFHGSVRDALAAYNAGPGDLAAGYGYADTILANAGEGINYTTGGGAGGSGAQNAETAAFLTSSSGGVLAGAGGLLHGSAVVLDRAFSMFAPGNGWRLVFGAVAGAAAVGAWKAYSSGSGEDGNTHLPVAIVLTGLALGAGFMAARPWPQTTSGPVRPGAYAIDVLTGQPPPSGPESFSPDTVHLTEAGLVTLLSLWAAGKAAQAAGGLAGAAGGVGGILGKVWGWIKGLGSEAEAGAEGAAAAAATTGGGGQVAV
jgi:hypothetical protein